MPNLTLSISEELHKKMKKHSEMRWSEVVRKMLEQRIDDLEMLNKLTSRSRLTSQDVEAISGKINKEVFEELKK